MLDTSLFALTRLDERSNAYCPVNTGLIMQAAAEPDENFRIDGEPLNVLELVAKVRNFSSSTMKVEVELFDEFGKVDAVIFKKSNEEPKQLHNFSYVENCYVHCFGQLKRFYSNTSFVIHVIRNVNHYSQVSCHRAKVMWASLLRRRLLKRCESIGVQSTQSYDMPSQDQLMNALPHDERVVLLALMQLRDSHLRTDKNSIFDSLPSKLALSAFEFALIRLNETGFIYKDDDNDLYYVS